MQPSLIIVSNRLPVSVKKSDGKLEFYPSIGGLATGLASYATNKRNKWIGWPGVASEEVTDAEKQQITAELRKHNCYPVFLTKKQLDLP
jgi:trehalose 6-phosphate synthase/phosphatase